MLKMTFHTFDLDFNEALSADEFAGALHNVRSPAFCCFSSALFPFVLCLRERAPF